MTGWKKHRQDELWTRQLFFAILHRAPGAIWTGTGGRRGGRGLWVAEEVTRLDGLFVANLSDSKACGFPASLKTVYPPEGQGAVGRSLSCGMMGLTNQPPSVFSRTAAWHVKQQLFESLVHCARAAALLLFVLFVFLCSAHWFCASYLIVLLNTLGYFC